MKQSIITVFSFFISIILLPYLFLILTIGFDLSFYVKRTEILESLLLWKCILFLEEGEEQSEKAQIVIARTNLYKELLSEKNIYQTIAEMKKEMEKEMRESGISSIKNKEKVIQNWKKRLEDTKGEILTWNGDVKELPVHICNAGKTRCGEEILGEEYTYLSAVESGECEEETECTEELVFNIEDMPKDIKVIDRDCSGYVRILQADGKLIAGEAFRQEYHLPSSNFEIYRMKKHLVFLCKGKGHGLGYSVYGGEILAQKGKKYQQILKTYFPKLQLEKL